MAVSYKRQFTCSGRFERAARARGLDCLAGLDEAGRGSLFGPVFAAAVILSPDRPVRGLRDSKQLEPERRQELAVLIRERALAWAVAAVDAFVIDRINIYQASRLAMQRAVEKLPLRPHGLLIDALTIDFPAPQKPIVHGDARCRSIAAASILAKVGRDACLDRWDEVFPQYGLSRHKGYTTPEHCKALEAHGPTPFHRFTFEPVRRLCPRALCDVLLLPEQMSLALEEPHAVRA